MSEQFYRGGLRFECTRCSRCCRIDPGYVFLSERDIRPLARFLGLDAEPFVRRYCRTVGVAGTRRLSLREKANIDRIFWDAENAEGGCTVYAARPLQCRSYPFWAANLGSAQEWEDAASVCPGIGRGRVHSPAEIERWLRRRAREPLFNPGEAEDL